MSHMNVINSILNGGFSAPFLCDLANERDAHFAHQSQIFVDHIKQFPFIKMQLPKDKDGYSTRQLKVVDTTVDGCASNVHCNFRVCIGQAQVTLCDAPNGGVRCATSFRIIDDLLLFPEELISDIVLGREFNAPITMAQDPQTTWEGKLGQRSNAADVRQSIQAAVKDLLLTGSGKCDVFHLTGSKDKKKRKGSVGTLSLSQWKSIARLFFRMNKYGEIDSNATASDFGLVNVDDYAVVVSTICHIHEVQVEQQCRWLLGNMSTYACDNELNGRTIKAYIENFGGKLR